MVMRKRKVWLTETEWKENKHLNKGKFNWNTKQFNGVLEPLNKGYIEFDDLSEFIGPDGEIYGHRG